jgi:putative transposase
MLRISADGPASVAEGLRGGLQTDPSVDAEDGLGGDLPGPRTSQPHPGHRIYPYLLRETTINRPNQVWCADVCYIPMRREFSYLVSIMDWATRKALSWRLLNTIDAEFCVNALKEVLAKYGTPEIFNTD